MTNNKDITEMNEFEIENGKNEPGESEICPLIQKEYDVNELLLKKSEINFIDCPLQKQTCPYSVFYGSNYTCKIKLEELEKRNKLY